MILATIYYYLVICFFGMVFMALAAMGLSTYENVKYDIKKKKDYKKWLLTGDRIDVSENGTALPTTQYFYPKREIKEYQIVSKPIAKYFAKKYLTEFEKNGIESEIIGRLKNIGVYTSIQRVPSYVYANGVHKKGKAQIHITCFMPKNENENLYFFSDNKVLTTSTIEDIKYILQNIIDEYPELNFERYV